MIDDNFQAEIQGIVDNLRQPQNQDLLFAVMQHLGENDSFMFTFDHADAMNFDDFCIAEHQIEALLNVISPERTEDLRTMSQRYDDYLARLSNNTGRLNEAQTARFDAIIARYDNGWSGGLYGLIMRGVQFYLRKVISG